MDKYALDDLFICINDSNPPTFSLLKVGRICTYRHTFGYEAARFIPATPAALILYAEV